VSGGGSTCGGGGHHINSAFVALALQNNGATKLVCKMNIQRELLSSEKASYSSAEDSRLTVFLNLQPFFRSSRVDEAVTSGTS
jgi:hypothetical protein